MSIRTTPPGGLSETELFAAYRQERLRVPVPAIYLLGLSVVVFTMVLLPLIYLAMVAGAGWLVYWHATSNLTIFHTIRNGKAALLVYAGPLIVGVLLCFFMIKPLFARRNEAGKVVEIPPGDEPLLSGFIERICLSVGAPVPTLIRFDNEVNASASFRSGFASFLANDLVLTIGLPLVRGLNLSEFAGVLAHEFGHFAQSSGMRMTYVIRSINYWFYRVVYEEDAWDRRLRQWSREIDLRLGIFFYLARFFVWGTRKILWVLMRFGQLISCFLLRQMEYDADRYEAALVGPDLFASTTASLARLSTARSLVCDDIEKSWREGKLPDNIAAMVGFHSERMDEGTLRAIRERQDAGRTSFLDTHPADRDRIASAGEVECDPLFRWPHPAIPPASLLFMDFDALARLVTLEQYRLSLGGLPDSGSLLDVGAMAREQELEKEFAGTLKEFFLDRFSPWRPMLVGESCPAAPSDQRAAVERLKVLLAEIQQGAAAFDAAWQSHLQLTERRIMATQARALLEAERPVEGGDFPLLRADLAGVETAEKRYEKSRVESERALARFEALQQERLRLALGLLRICAVRKRLDGKGVHRKRTAVYWKALFTLQAQLPALAQLSLDLARLDALVRQQEDGNGDEKLVNAIRLQMQGLGEGLRDLRRNLGCCDYPLEHSRPGLTLGNYIVGDLSQIGDIPRCREAVEETIENARDLITRLAGRLAETATAVEKVFSLSA